MAGTASADSFGGRVFYRPSGGVKLGPFLLWWLVALGGAAISAGLLFWLFLQGFYYMIIVPCIVALGVGALVRLAVTKGHCRNWFLTGLAGITAAIVLYLGYFYCGMVYHWGPRVASHPSLLPIYVKARMKSDVISEQGHPKPNKADAGSNWYFFIFEAATVLLIVSFPGIQRLRRPYCETCELWMKRQVTPFNPGTSAAIVDALRTRSSQALAALCATPVYASVPNMSIGIDSCPSLQSGGSRGCPVYVSVKYVAQSPGVANADPIDQAKGKLFLRALQASPAEIAALATRFKVLEAVAGRSFAPETAAPATADRQGELPFEIQAIEPEHAGKVLSRNMIVGGSILSLVPLLVFFGGLLLLARTVERLDRAILPADKFAAFGMLGVAAVCVLVGIAVAIMNPGYISNRILRKRLRGELARRSKSFVKPDNIEALPVEIVPKDNWGKVMLYSASDIGLLLLDESKRELLFEGDRQRFRIPVDALTYCGLEEFVFRQGLTKITTYYVVTVWRAPRDFGKHRSGWRETQVLLLGREKGIRPCAIVSSKCVGVPAGT